MTSSKFCRHIYVMTAETQTCWKATAGVAQVLNVSVCHTTTHSFCRDNGIEVIKALEAIRVGLVQVINNCFLDDADGMIWLPASSEP